MAEIGARAENFPLTYTEAVGQLLVGEQIQIYFDSTAGTNSYSDFDVTQNIKITGKLVSATGNMFIMECKVYTSGQEHTTTVYIGGWGILGISRAGDVPLEHVFSNSDQMRRKR